MAHWPVPVVPVPTEAFIKLAGHVLVFTRSPSPGPATGRSASPKSGSGSLSLPPIFAPRSKKLKLHSNLSNAAEIKVTMAWGNWCYCSRGGRGRRGAVYSVLPAAAVFLLAAALADVADGVAHERPAINAAAASAARSSAPASRPATPRRMASTSPAPAPMMNRMRYARIFSKTDWRFE